MGTGAPTKPSDQALETGGPRPSACLNCGAPLAGPFCAACGQRNIPPYPSLHELVIDAFSELSGWDGRFAVTVRALLRRPGILTREFLEGRRARYISPLRLYIVASLAYFVVAAAAPEVRPQSRPGVSLGVGINVDVGPRTRRSASTGVPDGATSRPDNRAELTPEEKAAALDEIAQVPSVIQPLLRRALEDPQGLKRGVLQTIPRTLFVLLPVFAAIVAIFYRRRKYPEHLYFAIHLHAFVFLVLAAVELVSFSRSVGLVETAGLVATIWIIAYATLAFRRVYGGRLGATLLKEAGIAAIYLVVTGVAFALTLYWVSMTV